MVTLLVLETTKPVQEELQVSQPTPLISGKFSEYPKAVDPADSNAKNEPVKEKTCVYETLNQDKLKTDILKLNRKSPC